MEIGRAHVVQCGSEPESERDFLVNAPLFMPEPWGDKRSELAAKLLIGKGTISADFSECALIQQANESDLQTAA